MSRTIKALATALALTAGALIPTTVAPKAQAIPLTTNYTRITDTNWDTFKTGRAPYFSITIKMTPCSNCAGIPGRAQLKLDGVSQRWHTLDHGSTTFRLGRDDLRNNTWVEVAVRTWPKSDARPSKVVKFDVRDSQPTRGDRVMAVARNQLGKPYKFGADGPDSYDCSGLITYAYWHGARIRLPHYTGSLRHAGRVVSKPQKGDIAWSPGHVSLCAVAGCSVVIEAARPGTNVRRVSRWQKNVIYIRP